MITLRSTREIEKMLVAGQLVRQAHQKVAELVKPGITTAELDKAVDDLFTEAGAIPLFKGVPGKVPFPAATCVSVNDEVVHGIPGKRILKEGDIVSVDTGAKIGGWCGDSAWTYAVGEISDEAKKLMEVTERALQVAIELLPVKKRWSQVAKEMQNEVESAGFSVITTLVGHGIGTTMHEEPQVPNYDSREFRQKGDFDLRPGLVIAVEPMVAAGREDLYLHGDGWTLSTKDRSLTAHFEHTLALTSSGVRILTGEGQAVAMTVLVVGATGATGKLLVEQLLRRGYQVRVIVRSADRLPDSVRNHPAITIAEANLLELTDDELTQHVSGCEAVASCLGHSLTFKGVFGHPRRLVTDATRRLCRAIEQANPAGQVRFVLMNTAGNQNRDLDEPATFANRIVVSLIRWAVPPHADNEQASDVLRQEIGKNNSALNWVVVRPDSLVNQNEVTEYELASSPTRDPIFNAGTTSRINVAHFMADLATDQEVWGKWVGQMPVIYNRDKA